MKPKKYDKCFPCCHIRGFIWLWQHGKGYYMTGDYRFKILKSERHNNWIIWEWDRTLNDYILALGTLDSYKTLEDVIEHIRQIYDKENDVFMRPDKK